jgi:hypothetical protein
MQIIRQTGLRGFTGAINTTAPNETVNIAQLLANAISTNGDVVITSKGTGAYIVGNPPDSTATGGNKRGQNAIDLQTSRTLATQVVSGNNSFAIGNSNRNGGDSSGLIGFTNINSSYGYSFAIGYGCNIDAHSSYAIGDRANTTSLGKLAFASGRESTTIIGDNQTGLLHLRNRTTNATPTPLTSDSNAIGVPNNILILNNKSSFLIEALVTGRTTDGAKQIGIKLTALAERGATASTTALVGNQVKSTIANKGSVTWDANLIADTTFGGIYVQVTGEASTTIQWSATLISDENTY